MALVVVGGCFGAAAREAVEQALPSAAGGFPVATFVINLAGAAVLGLLIEALVRSGDDSGWRRRVRLGVGTGFCGAFTTYSTFAVEATQLGRVGDVGTAVAYVVATVVGGLLMAAAGVWLAAAGVTRRPARAMPVDPDLEEGPKR